MRWAFDIDFRGFLYCNGAAQASLPKQVDSRWRNAARKNEVPPNMAPMVSIGLPVHNGMPYLPEAIDSLLEQSHEDFELIISDNASTDGSADVCRHYAEIDSRVAYHRNETNMGAAWNFNKVFALSRGRYFRWCAHDDICHPDLLACCVKALDEMNEVVLAYPKTVTIDASGRPMRVAGHHLRVYDPRVFRRFGSLICTNHACLPVFGLMRREALAQTRLIGTYVASDRVLLTELVLQGRFYEVPKVLFFHRDHAGRSTKAHCDMRSRARWFDPKNDCCTIFPNWRLLKEYTGSLSRAQLKASERSICWFQFLPWLAANWRGMIRDVLAGTREMLIKSLQPVRET